MKTQLLSVLLSLLMSLFAVEASATQVKALHAAHSQNPNDSLKCYEIILKDGTIIKANIQKITDQSIEYTRCNSTTPSYTISRSKVLSIKHPDGTVEKLATTSAETGASTSKGLTGAILAFASSLLGLILLPALMGLIALIWGSLSLSKMIKNGTTGKGFAYAAIAIGFIDLLWAVLLLALA